jgi:hypothetical protein
MIGLPTGARSMAVATRHEAELTAKPIARQLATKLFIHLPDGRTACRNFAKSWIAKLL